MKNIIFIAPPATGKGTQSGNLKEEYGYKHISTGDLLRAEVATGSDLGKELDAKMQKGELISDEIVTELLKKAFAAGGPFVLDGYPRNVTQAETLDNLFTEAGLNDYVAMYLIIDKNEAMKRALGRITCGSCNKIYHLYNEDMKPKTEGICDVCGGELISRSDDNEESFNIRFDTYIEKTTPVIDYYKNKGKLIEIEVADNSKETFEMIKSALGI